MNFSQNYFQLLGINESFDIDLQDLASNYKKLQIQTHPDKNINASPHEKRLSIQTSAYINQAYNVLRDCTKRAQYLLEIKNIEINDEQDTINDSEFLAHQLELHEELEYSMSNDKESCEDFLTKIKKYEKELFEDFSRQYLELDYQNAKESVLKMKFYRRLKMQSKEREM
jgi:molecular chaperone HscB